MNSGRKQYEIRNDRHLYAWLILGTTQEQRGEPPENYAVMQRQNVAYAYFTSKQILSFAFAEQLILLHVD